MASTSPLCPADRLHRRADLVVRPLPELRMCMVYRPRPARIVTLNPASWLLLQACAGSTVGEIESALPETLAAKGRPIPIADIRHGLAELVELSLVRVEAAGGELRTTNEER